jgi:hypothetical protein
MIRITQGIEGDDLPWHFNLLEITIPNNFYFIPLVDHYNLHTTEWTQYITDQAQSATTLVFYDLVHTGDYEHAKFVKYITDFAHPNKIYLTVNQQNFFIDNVKIVPWDFMWNRFKSYYTETIPNNLTLHHCSRGDYHQHNLDYTKQRRRLFLSPMGRDYGFRSRLFNIVKEYNGYISNRSQGITFEQEPVIGIFKPIPAEFYLDSYFSIYAESNSFSSELIHLTEKTFEPLTKGHFILPYSNPGTIQRLKDMGFQFPKFIDYSFDHEVDATRRFEMLINEFNKLITMDLATLYQQHQEILEHNKNCINTIPYDQRIQEIFNV